MSVRVINYTIINENQNLFRNPRFIISVSFIVFFIYKLAYEWAYQYARITGKFVYSNILTASFGYVNALQNFIFAFAVLLIPPDYDSHQDVSAKKRKAIVR
jgi:hypothetical protein